MDCDWRLFSEKSKDCTSCEDYEVCREKTAQKNPVGYMYQGFMTDGVVEADAKEFAELIREMDTLNNELLRDELGLPIESDDSEQEADSELELSKKEAKQYQALTPIAEFLNRENIPHRFIPPDIVLVSSFMFVKFESNEYTIRLTNTKGVPFDTKVITRAYKYENKIFKYAKKGKFDEVFPLIKSIIFTKKNK